MDPGSETVLANNVVVSIQFKIGYNSVAAISSIISLEKIRDYQILDILEIN